MGLGTFEGKETRGDRCEQPPYRTGERRDNKNRRYGRANKCKEKADRAKRQNNIVISGIKEEEGENARSLKLRIQELLETHLDMAEVPIEGAHRVGRQREGETRPKIIVCTVMDERKRRIILESSSTYLRGTDVYINEDRTTMQQAEVRKKVAERKARLEKKKKDKQERDNNSDNNSDNA